MNRLSFLTGCTRLFDEFGPSRATVRVIRADEEWMIANMVCRVLGLTIERKHDYENKRGV
jgi:prophage antirepressor-like protein